MRRLSHLENVNRLKITEGEDMVLYLSSSHNIESVKRKRKILEYYDAIMKDRPHLTIDGVSTIKNVFEFISSPNQSSVFEFNQGTSSGDKTPENLNEIIAQNINYLEK